MTHRQWISDLHFSSQTPPTCHEYVEKSEIPRISGYPHPVIFRTSGPSRNTHPPSYTRQLPRTPSWVHDLLYFCIFQLPPSLPSWTPMETVASWHGEVNYKRYQSLGVVGRLVGLGSTDSQLPLRADPRARAIVPSLSSSPYPSLSLPISLSFITTSSDPFYFAHRHPASFPPPSIFRPHISGGSRQFDTLGAHIIL